MISKGRLKGCLIGILVLVGGAWVYPYVVTGVVRPAIALIISLYPPLATVPRVLLEAIPFAILALIAYAGLSRIIGNIGGKKTDGDNE